MWITHEEVFLKSHYKIMSNKELGVKLHKTTRSIRDKSRRMGLERTKEEINKIISNGMQDFFKKGNYWSRRRKVNLYNKRNRRIKCLDMLGGKCVNCDMKDYDVLHFDHKNDDGYKYQDIGILEQVEKHPEWFQILCSNCNTKKRIYFLEFMRLIREEIPPF